MKIALEKIRVAERIRKLTPEVNALAKDIQKNGLINPITVMAVGDADTFQLLAGLRRLRAVASLGWNEVDVTVVPPKDAEAALNIEYSENVQREAFTFSEKMDYAKLIAEIEKAKAHERKVIGGETAGRSRPQKDGPQGAQPIEQRNPRVRDIVGRKIGISGQQYGRATYIAKHAPQKIIDELDRGERSIRGTYDELRASDQKAGAPIKQTDKRETHKPDEAVTTCPAIQTDLERAIRAERELDDFKYRQHNEIYHRETIIENLKIRVANLEAALKAANARIRELEGEGRIAPIKEWRSSNERLDLDQLR